MVHRDYPRNSEKLASYRKTNRSCLSSPSPSPSPPTAPLIFFKFHIKFKDEDWVEDQNSPVLIGKSDGPVTSASAHVPVGKLSFSNIRDSIEQALKRAGVPSVFRHELIVFAWDDVRRNFVRKPIAGGGINGFLVDIEVVVRRRRVTVAPSLSCSICLEDFSGEPKQFLRLPCSHFFHSRCIIGWLKRMRMRMSCSCPLCRRPL